MSYPVKQSSTGRPLLFLLLSSSDHVTGATGKTPTVTISKNGGAFAAPAGAVTELANGWYQVAGNATDTNTLGPLVLHATASGCDPTDVVFAVEEELPGQLALPAQAAGRPTTLTGMIRRVFEWAANKKTRDRATGLKKVYGTDGTTVLETQTQSTTSGVDQETQGA